MAGRELENLVACKLPRTCLAEVASLATRVSAADIAVNLLNPIVRPPPRSPVIATADEKAQYARALIRIGALYEGMAILASLDPVETPVVLLFQTFGYVAQWNYKATISLLRRYIEAPAITAYQRLVGKVNLLAAYVHERDWQAQPLLEELRQETARMNAALLRTNVLTLEAEKFIKESEWARAESALDQAQKVLSDTKSLDGFFIDMWRAILNLRRAPGKQTLEGLRIIREQAHNRRHWETLRQVDWVQAEVTRNPPRLTHLYFGTPFVDFREALGSSGLEIAAEYFWGNELERPVDFVFDLAEGKSDLDDCELKAGQLIHRTLSVLASDFYRPFQIARLHSKVFPQEFYDPTTSPLKIHQALTRLRTWLGKHLSGLNVIERDSCYALEWSPSARFHISLRKHQEHSDRWTWYLQKLEEKFPSGQFTKRDVCQAMGVSPTQARSILKRGFEQKKVASKGQGKSTRYRFQRAA